MHCFTFTLLLGMLITCGTLAAAEPTTRPAATDADARSVADQLDNLIVAKLKPAEDLKPIRIRARLLIASSDARPTTQPAEIVLDLTGNELRQLKQDELDQRKLDEQARALAEAERAIDAQLALRRAHEQADSTYLGIGVEAPDDTLRAQLSLPSGAGLVINYVDENGPSKSAVQLHDVLQKLDDQLLINGEQLVALVRMHKPGDTVSLTLLRKAKPVSVDVELGRRKVSQANPTDAKSDVNAAMRIYAPQSLQAWTVAPEASTINAASSYWNNSLQPYLSLKQPPMTFNDGEMLVSITGRGELVAVDIKSGRVLYHGPIGTGQQWNALPAAVRDRLVSWQHVVQPAAANHPAQEKPEPRTK